MTLNIPLVIIGPMPQQEKDNPRLIRDHGLGVVSESPSDIHTIIRSLTDGGGHLGQIRSAQRSFRRPDIAKDIAVYVSELAGLPERFP